MPRKPRIHYSGAFYHLFSRGNQKQPIFFDQRDHSEFISRLQHYHKKYPFQLYAYALMPNHFHCLIEAQETPLSKIFQAFLSSYTQYFNKKYGRVGHLFQGRYKAILCDKESYLLELVRYVHLNPLRANLTQNLADYPWTTYSVYIGQRQESWIETHLVLSQFSSKIEIARDRFAQFILDGISLNYEDPFEKIGSQRIQGSSEFNSKVEKKLQETFSCFWEISLDEIENEVCRVLGTYPKVLQHPDRTRKEARARIWIAYFWKRLKGGTFKEVGKRYQREPTILTMQMKRLQKLLDQDPNLQKEMAHLERKLIQNKKRFYPPNS
ncbi:MAG: transposase [Deltaproteobacteria bacterium]|nr:transposase [Deltaproteobacteria bacterium]